MPRSRLFRWLRNAVAALLALALVAVGGVYALSARELARVSRAEVPPFTLPLPTDSASLAEGERIAFTRGCLGCHGERLQGKVFFSEPGVATLVASNLTTLARQASDADLERAIRHGIGRDGRALFIMPAEMYRVLTDEDVARVIAFIRSVPEATDTLPARTVGPLGRLGLLLGQFHPSRYYIETETIPPPPEDTALRAGHYIAWSSCTECHGGTLAGDGAGSPALGPMALAYSAEEFVEFLRTGTAKGGRELPMMGGVARGRLKNLREEEMLSLHAYLRELRD
jgi:mono/diheme cytochrome c family protein